MRRAIIPVVLSSVVTCLAGCGAEQGHSREAPSPAAPSPAPVSSSPTRSLSIAKLHPAETPAGTPFNVQPNGAAALAVSGSGFVKGDAISWNGTTLTTTFGNEGLLSAIVPPELFAKPGDVVIAVKNPADPAAGEARATFKVLRAP